MIAPEETRSVTLTLLETVTGFITYTYQQEMKSTKSVSLTLLETITAANSYPHAEEVASTTLTVTLLGTKTTGTRAANEDDGMTKSVTETEGSIPAETEVEETKDEKTEEDTIPSPRSDPEPSSVNTIGLSNHDAMLLLVLALALLGIGILVFAGRIFLKYYKYRRGGVPRAEDIGDDDDATEMVGPLE